MPVHADTVYRCGEAYSTSNQCGNTTAEQIKPSSFLNATSPAKSAPAVNDLREAQTLEKQRLQAERQASQTPPVRLGPPPPLSVGVTNHAPLAPNAGHPAHAKSRSTHARNAASPYFTAVDPNAPPKKKSTAKAVPATTSP